MSELVGALGVSRGTFLEMGAHDGEFESNSIFLEACWRWRAILLEPNPSSFAMVRRGRPGALAVRAAVCREPGQVTFAVRFGAEGMQSTPTGGVESVLRSQLGGRMVGLSGRNKTNNGPAKWLRGAVTRFQVPCAPMRQVFNGLLVERLDVFFLDVEGSELATLQSIDFGAVSIGVLVVEMRSFDCATNPLVFALLEAEGYENVGIFRVWPGKIYDVVFLRSAHFLDQNPRVTPNLALRVLAKFKKQRHWQTRPGRLRGARGRPEASHYVIYAPRIMGFLCGPTTNFNQTVGALSNVRPRVPFSILASRALT